LAEVLVMESRLSDLNFNDLLHYGGQPEVQYRYAQSLSCQGYCVSCEESGLLKQPDGTDGRLDLMSHGCGSEDFEHALGQPMPRDGSGVEQPVLFLLENPGGDLPDIGTTIEYRGSYKQPPVNHYYWTPGTKSWPSDAGDKVFNGNWYGPYFAYLMRFHQLLNVYITNVIKCRWVGVGKRTPTVIITNCTKRYLTREVQLFAPKLVLCFGKAAAEEFRKLEPNFPTEWCITPLILPTDGERLDLDEPSRNSFKKTIIVSKLP
jgi:hypothetical protein